MKTVAVALLALAMPAVGGAGPLGLEMGAPLADLQSRLKLKQEAPHQFSTPSLPDGHPDFNDYRLVITPQHGLCKVIAWTPSIRTSIYGTELLSQFDGYYNTLIKKYGTAKRFDYLRSGSIWNDDKFWMMALHRKERTLVAYWIEKEVQLPDNLLT